MEKWPGDKARFEVLQSCESVSMECAMGLKCERPVSPPCVAALNCYVAIRLYQ